MAFKMKGSPIKLGKIQGTSGHVSALFQKSQDQEPAPGGPKMKSPMKQDERSWYKKLYDEATQIGQGLKNMPYKGSYGGSPDAFGSRFMSGYKQEERADDPVYQQELLKKEELKKKENRKIEIEQDKQSDIIKAEKKLEFEQDSKNWSDAMKKKYLNEDGTLKKEHQSIWGFGENARYRDGKKQYYSEEYDSWN